MADCPEETHTEVLVYLVYSCGVPDSQGLTGKPPFKCIVLPSVSVLEVHFATPRPISGQENRPYLRMLNSGHQAPSQKQTNAWPEILRSCSRRLTLSGAYYTLFYPSSFY